MTDRWRVDAHVHFWQLARGDYFWMAPELAPIYRDFGPEDLRAHLERNGIDRIIVVQAADTVAETEFMLEIAETTDFVAGVVGWVPFDRPQGAEELARLAAMSAITTANSSKSCSRISVPNSSAQSETDPAITNGSIHSSGISSAAASRP